MNAVASRLAEWPARLRSQLAIVPAGTGNNLARDFGLPLDPTAAFDLAVDATPESARPTDLLAFDDLGKPESARRYALQSGALGFPAQVAARYDRLRESRLFRTVTTPLGQYVYRLLAGVELVGQAFRQWRGRGAVGTRITFDEATIEAECVALFLHNERSLGGNFFPCPDADPADGHIDLCWLTVGPVRRYPRLFGAVCRGRHVGRFDEVANARSAGPIEIERTEPEPLFIDGDLPLNTRHLRVTLLPNHLSIIRK